MKRTSKLKENGIICIEPSMRWFNLGYLVTLKNGTHKQPMLFFKRLVKQFDEPKVVVTDKAPSITSAFKKLKEYGFYQGTEHRTIKYLNNLIEQDHRPVKRRTKFYRSLRTASSTIKGMEDDSEDYIRKPEKKALSSGFQPAENQGIIGNPILNHRYRKGFYSLFKTLQQNLFIKFYTKIGLLEKRFNRTLINISALEGD